MAQRPAARWRAKVLAGCMKVLRFLLMLLVLAAAGSAAAVWWWLERPLALATPTVELSIEPGTPPREVAAAWVRAGVLTEPAALQLDEAASRELLDIVRPLFETEGFTLHWAAPDRWLATHVLFDGLATASLDRVTGRNVDPWLPDQRSARLIRRLQNEVQMLLYTHPVNDRREAAGLPTVNSFWLSGCGRAPAAPPTAEVQVDDRLRAPALGEDWAAWCEAWRALDAGPLARLAQQGGALTLCGERHAVTFTPQPQGLWQRLSSAWRKPALLGVLERL